MRMLELKAQTRFLTHHACRNIKLNDVVIEWIDIMFENALGASLCPPHSHDWFEFNYVAEGSMRTAFEDGNMHNINAGDYILIPPGCLHSHEYDAVSPHEGLCLRWRLKRNTLASEEGIDQVSLYDKLNQLSVGTPVPMKDVVGIAAMLEHLLAESEAGEQAIFVQTSFLRFLLKLAESLSEIPVAGYGDEATVDRLVRKVDIFLNDLQDRELDVKQLAASLHLSYGHLAREYKRRTGLTIVERLTEIRLTKAVEDLTRTNLTMGEIAFRSGFASVYYFSRVFKQKYGVSPSRFRAGFLIYKKTAETLQFQPLV
ncbi:helix-turn-helix transcriptional regulator [Cohnella soli]|uniref:Helix-turn-helix domain-containing protein n=1 Tax=Cohnella soli TaxID=425005 RepID=A0ABW0I794_9BACL